MVVGGDGNDGEIWRREIERSWRERENLREKKGRKEESSEKGIVRRESEEEFIYIYIYQTYNVSFEKKKTYFTSLIKT